MKEKNQQEKDTSILSAFTYALDQPLENIGTTLEAMGFEDAGQYLKDLTEAPDNYESATEGFLNKNGFGFDVSYLPRAVIEQAGQLAGSIATRIAGGVAGGALAGPAGAITGAILAPTLFEAAQIAGPVALARARANGRDEPNWEDWSGAGGTALGSGLLNAFGVYGIGKLNSTIYGSALREGVTEGLQGLGEQIGSTLLTEAGLQIDPKAAIGEGLIGGTVGGVAQTPSSIYAKTRQEIEAEEVGETPLLPAPVTEEPIIEEPVVAEQPTTDQEPIILPPPPTDYNTVTIRDLFTKTQKGEISNFGEIDSELDELFRARSIDSLEEEFLEASTEYDTYPYAEFTRALEEELKRGVEEIRAGDRRVGVKATNMEELANSTLANLGEKYENKAMDYFFEYTENPAELSFILDRYELVDEFSTEEIAEAAEETRDYLRTHGGEFRSAIAQETLRQRNFNLLQQTFSQEDISDSDQIKEYLNGIIFDQLDDIARRKETRLQGTVKFERADKRFLKPDYRKLNYTPGLTPALLKPQDGIRLQDNIETLGGGDLLADLQIDPNFASVSVIRETIKNMPARDKAINYYNELITGDSKKDKLAQQEIEDSELDKFLKLKGEEEITKEEIDQHMEGYMAGMVVEATARAYRDIGLKHDAKAKDFELNHTYVPRLNPEQETRVEQLQEIIDMNTPTDVREEILDTIKESPYSNTVSHFTSPYGRPLFWVRGASGTLYTGDGSSVPDVKIIHEIQNDYAQQTRDPDQTVFTKRFIDKQTPLYKEYEERKEQRNKTIATYKKVKAKDVYPDEMRDDNEIYFEYEDLKDMRGIVGDEHNPMITFASLVYDSDLPKRFYDGSLQKREKTINEKIDKLTDELINLTDDNKYYDLNKQRDRLYAESEGLEPVIPRLEYKPPKNVTLVVDVLQDLYSKQPGPDGTAIRRPTIPAYLFGQRFSQFEKDEVTLAGQILHDVEQENFVEHMRMVAKELNKREIPGVKTEAEVEAYLDTPGSTSVNNLLSFRRAFNVVAPFDPVDDQALIEQYKLDRLQRQLATRTHSKLQTRKKIAEAYKAAAQQLVKDRPQIAELFPKLENIEATLQDPVLKREPPKGYRQYKDDRMEPLINQPFNESYIRKSVLSTMIDSLKKGERYVAVPNDQTQRNHSSSSQTTAGGTYDLATQELRDIAAQYDLPILELYITRDEKGLMTTIDLEPLRELIANGEFKGFPGYKKGGVVKKPPVLYKVNYGDYGRSYK